MVLMLSVYPLFCVRLSPPHFLNIEKCPSGHGFNSCYLSTTSSPAKHRKNAQMGMFSMLCQCPPLLYPPKKCPPGHVFDAERVCTISLTHRISKLCPDVRL